MYNLYAFTTNVVCILYKIVDHYDSLNKFWLLVWWCQVRSMARQC